MTDLETEIRRLRRSHRRLQTAFVALLLCAGVAVLVGAKSITKNATFHSIDAERINIREPDGTLRLTISNRDSFPGAFVKNKEIKHPRDMAGFLFMNDEGTEQGGLIYNGRLETPDHPSSGLSLTFDRYQQDQQMQLLGVDENGRHFAGISFNDVADGQERPVFSARDKAEMEAGHHAITPRVYLGKAADQNATLQLMDAAGKPRITFRVTPSGDARILFLDEHGRTVKEISAANEG